jgi:hypothetical protein
MSCDNTSSNCAPVGTVFKLDDAPLHFFHCVCTFLDREFPDYWIGGGDPFLGPLSRFDFFVLFLLGVCKRQCLS